MLCVGQKQKKNHTCFVLIEKHSTLYMLCVGEKLVLSFIIPAGCWLKTLYIIHAMCWWKYTKHNTCYVLDKNIVHYTWCLLFEKHYTLYMFCVDEKHCTLYL